MKIGGLNLVCHTGSTKIKLAKDRTEKKTKE